MHLWTHPYRRSTKRADRHRELAAPLTIYRQESKRSRRARSRAINRRAERAMKGTRRHV